MFKQPSYILFRSKKDPRDLKVLDPACGSGHFLLYAFDLLVTIYEEGWEDEVAPKSELTGRTLREDYPDIDTLHAELPRLILRHNLYGIDIDTRATQIAALALWMHAQGAYNDFGFRRSERALIVRTNIVAAEPMPGEQELRQEFVSSIDQQLGQLVDRVFERMELVSEAGALLKIENEIETAVRDTYGRHGELFQKTDEERWCEGEEQLLTALESYAEQVQDARAYRRRLFAEDAARGLGFIDLCRQRYDVILMNPPYGQVPTRAKSLLIQNYPHTHTDEYFTFIQRAWEDFRVSRGVLGAITSRTFLFHETALWLRDHYFLTGRHNFLLADLGHGVLDRAMNETCAFVLSADGSSNATHLTAFRLIDRDDKAFYLLQNIQALRRDEGFGDETFSISTADIACVPNRPISYWVPQKARDTFKTFPSLKSIGVEPRLCLQTGDNERFIRLIWEVEEGSTSRWCRLAKGGEESHFWSDINLLVNWEWNGQRLKLTSNRSWGLSADGYRASNTMGRKGLHIRCQINLLMYGICRVVVSVT